MSSYIVLHACKLEVPLSPLVAEAVPAAAAAAAARAILMAFLVFALALAAAEATVVPEAVFTTAAAAEGAVVSPSVESLESPPGRLARLLVDLHRLRQARLKCTYMIKFV